ncbi:MAG: thiamine pyrophosphate-dependent enzyme [Bradymonadaceae bacterium]
MPRLKTLAQNESKEQRFRSGHSMCRGCGIPMVVRTVLNSISTPVVVVNATGCLEVSTSRFPTTAWNVPWLHVAFENAAAVVSGVETAWRVLRRRGVVADEEVTFVCFGGDGGTYDIGLQALSGALERGHRFLYVCYDNQAYMNTGVQRSSATPVGASTSTSPCADEVFGKTQLRKDLTTIAVAHHIPYVAQGAISHWQDLSEKVARAVAAPGPALLNVLTTCPLGWRHPPEETVDVSRLAVETRYWPLYEVCDGHYRLTFEPSDPLPVAEWLRRQGRFDHLFKASREEVVDQIQDQVDRQWETLMKRCAGDAKWFDDRPYIPSFYERSPVIDPQLSYTQGSPPEAMATSSMPADATPT